MGVKNVAESEKNAEPKPEPESEPEHNVGHGGICARELTSVQMPRTSMDLSLPRPLSRLCIKCSYVCMTPAMRKICSNFHEE